MYIQAVRLIVSMFGLAYKARLPSPYIVLDPGPYIFAINSTFGDKKIVENGAVTILIKYPGAEFHILCKLVSLWTIAIDFPLV